MMKLQVGLMMIVASAAACDGRGFFDRHMTYALIPGRFLIDAREALENMPVSRAMGLTDYRSIMGSANLRVMWMVAPSSG